MAQKKREPGVNEKSGMCLIVLNDIIFNVVLRSYLVNYVTGIIVYNSNDFFQYIMGEFN